MLSLPLWLLPPPFLWTCVEFGVAPLIGSKRECQCYDEYLGAVVGGVVVVAAVAEDVAVVVAEA